MFAIILFVVAMALPFPPFAKAEDVIEGCYPLTMEDAARFNVPQFDDYPVKKIFKGKPACVDVRTQARARRFRTMLRDGAAGGPNFAGHYTVVGWGCGTSCVEFGIVDAKTGRVFFPPGIPFMDGNFVDLGPDEPESEFITIRYRLNSRLLVLLGTPGEDSAKGGITYFEWTGSSLKTLRFIRNCKKRCPDEETPKIRRNRRTSQ